MKVIILLFLISSSYQQSDDAIDNELLNEIFGQTDNLQDLSSSSCELIEGRTRGCQECFTCNHSSIADYRRRNVDIQQLTFKTASCAASTTVCCVNLQSLLSRSNERCGVRVETRGRRAGPRSILQGEFPWHTHVYYYYNGMATRMCASTFISDVSGALVAPATCVNGLPVENLRISFHVPLDVSKLVRVKSVTLHERYNPVTYTNDIALLKVTSILDIPLWASPVCLPEQAPQHATPCLSIASNYYYINSVVPRKSTCGVSDDSQMCSGGCPGDYVPEVGAGLFCEIENAKSLNYELHGIHLFPQDKTYSTYTNVSNLIQWINRKL